MDMRRINMRRVQPYPLPTLLTLKNKDCEKMSHGVDECTVFKGNCVFNNAILNLSHF